MDNIDGNLFFVDAPNFDFTLTSNSAGLNAGTIDTTGLSLQGLDIKGNPRVIGSRNDMGAFENTEIITSTLNEMRQNNIIFYPSPTKGLAHVTIANKKIQTVEVNDIKGDYIATYTLIDDYINLENLPSGLYMLKVFTENTVLHTKIIKE